METFYCVSCKQEKTHTSEFTTGYGVKPNGDKVCFDCCAIGDIQYMKDHGKNTLYLTWNDKGVFVSNWPGTFKAHCPVTWKSGHNWGLTRYNVRFNGPDKKVWYGYTIGDNTQICHCKSTKLESVHAA